jgi:hypothetical protein
VEVTSPGPRAIAVGGDVAGSVFITGDVGISNPYPALNDYYYDFREDIASAREFVGREAVFEYLAEFERSRSTGYIRIIADAGLGKTALAAEAARRFAAPAFFTNVSRGLARPDQLLNHLSVVLIARFDLPHDHLPNRAGEDSSFLSLLLNEAAEKAIHPIWIIVDALDEADESVAGRNTMLLPTHLPPRVYFMLTQRPGDYPLVTDPSTSVVDYPIPWDAPMHQSDVEAYLQKQVEWPEIARARETATPPVHPLTFVSRLKYASQGNFMYLSYLLADIAAGAPHLSPLDLEAIPNGLDGYYGQMWSRMEAIARAEGREEWKSLYRPVAGMLAAAGEPVTVAWLAELSGNDSQDIQDQILIPWRRFLTAERDQGSESWRIIHRSFADFLSGKLDLPRMHGRIAAYYLEYQERWAAHNGYAARNLGTHLRLAGDTGGLADLVNNRIWYEHQLAADPSGAGYLNDLSQAWTAASSADTEAVSQGNPAPFLGREVHYALASASLHSLSGRITSDHLFTLFQEGILSAPQALAITHQSPHPAAKSRHLIAIAPLLPKTMLPQALATARSIDERDRRVSALVAIAAELTGKEKADILREALIAARSMEDNDYFKVEALIAAGSELSEGDRDLVQNEAVFVARSFDPDERTSLLAALAVELDEPKRTQLLEEALAAARLNEDTESRAATLIGILNDLDLQEDETRRVAAEALVATRPIADSDGHALVSLLSYIPEADRPLLAEEALAAVHAMTDPTARAAGLGRLLPNLPRTLTAIVLDEALTAAHAIPDVEARMQQLSALVGLVPVSARTSLLEETLALARSAAAAEVRAARLTLLATQLAGPETRHVRDEALAAAREIENDRAKAEALVRIATALPENQTSPLRQEAFSIPAALQAVGASEADEVEWIETLVAAARKLGAPEARNTLLSEAVTVGRAIERPYDRAYALVMLAPSLTGSGKDQVVREVLDAARTIDGFREQAEVLTALIPMLDPIERDEATREALAAIRESDWTEIALSGRMNFDGVVEIDRFSRFPGGQSEALLDVALSVDKPECTLLLHEAFDAIYGLRSDQQASAITSLAPHLIEEQVRKALADIRSIKIDPRREQTVRMLLLSLAEMAPPGVALKEARAIYGQSVPEALSAALAGEPPQQQTHYPDQASLSQADNGTEQQLTPPEHLADDRPSAVIYDDSDEIINDNDKAGPQISYTLTGDQSFDDIYRLGEFITITLDPDNFQDKPEQRQQILDVIFAGYLEHRSGQLSQDEVMDALASIKQFRRESGHHGWRQAVTALLVRMASLGFADEALAEARSTWGQPMPAEVVASLAPVVSEADRDGLFKEALASARGREDGIDLIGALAALVRQLPEPDRAQASSMLKAAVKGLKQRPSASELASIAPHLSGLPSEERLLLWQKALQFTSTGIRRDLLSDLPQILTLIEGMAGHDFWSQLVDSLRMVRQWWP